MMRRRGTLFVECLIAILIFLIGVIALASSLAYSLRAIVQSREALSRLIWSFPIRRRRTA